MTCYIASVANGQNIRERVKMRLYLFVLIIVFLTIQSLKINPYANTHEKNNVEYILDYLEIEVDTTIATLSELSHFLEIYRQNNPNHQDLDKFQYILGLVYYNDRNFLKAQTIFEQFIGNYPASRYKPNVLNRLGDCYYTLGKLHKAVDTFNMLINKHQDYELLPNAMYTMTWTFLDLNDNSKAISAFNSFVT